MDNLFELMDMWMDLDVKSLDDSQLGALKSILDIGIEEIDIELSKRKKIQENENFV